VHGSSVEDYLKVILKLSLTHDRVSTTLVSESQGVSPAAVTKMIRRLKALGLITYVRKTGIKLSQKGRRIALEVIRHHRLIELYLTQALGFSWDKVHEEAEKLEHVISEDLEERIAEYLGQPTHDPHGSPIPTREGRMGAYAQDTLTQLQAGQTAIIRRVSDSDSDRLRYLSDLGFNLHQKVKVLGRDPYGGPLRVKIAGKELAIGQELAETIFVMSEEIV